MCYYVSAYIVLCLCTVVLYIFDCVTRPMLREIAARSLCLSDLGLHLLLNVSGHGKGAWAKSYRLCIPLNLSVLAFRCKSCCNQHHPLGLPKLYRDGKTYLLQRKEGYTFLKQVIIVAEQVGVSREMKFMSRTAVF